MCLLFDVKTRLSIYFREIIYKQGIYADPIPDYLGIGVLLVTCLAILTVVFVLWERVTNVYSSLFLALLYPIYLTSYHSLM